MVGVDAEVVVTHLFAPERASLLELLSSLAPGSGGRPRYVPGWSVNAIIG
jgi:hypothetical protein